MAGCIAYAGKGFSDGVLHMLAGVDPHAAYCLPLPIRPTRRPTRSELDHLLAMHFGWWDVFVGKKKPVSATSPTTTSNDSRSTATVLELTDSFLNAADFKQ